MGQEWDEDPESLINQSGPAAAQVPGEDSNGAVVDDDGSFSPELFDEDEVCTLSSCCTQRIQVVLTTNECVLH